MNISGAPVINLDATVYVDFYSEPVEDAKASLEAGRPIFKEAEFVRVRQAGDRKREHVAPAHEQFMLERGTGLHITYAQRYSEQYNAFKRKDTAYMSGTPLDFATFLTPSQRAEFKAAQILTIEGLAGLPDRVIAQFGPNMRGYVRQAQELISKTQDSAATAKLEAENQELRDRMAKLEAIMAKQSAKASKNDEPTDEELREQLEAAGISVRANASRERLLAAVADL